MDTQIDMQELRKAIIWKWDYDPEFGSLRNRVSNQAARLKCAKGYIKIEVLGKSYYAHRVAFLIMEARWPEQIDHINRIRDDNRWINLREANQVENARNHGLRVTNTSGVMGVGHSERHGWVAEMTRNGTRKRVKSLPNFEAAIAARKEMEDSFARGEW